MSLTLILLDVSSLLSFRNKPKLREDEMWMRNWNGLTELLAETSHAITPPVYQQCHVTRVLTATPLKTRVHARGLTQGLEVTSPCATF